jgi:glycosyltransferase involved in cell wall biosynthesis
MSNLEEAIKSAAERAVVKFIGDGAWLIPDYDASDWIAACWKLVDGEKLKAKIAERLEQELADRMVNKIAEELSTDIKQILSVKERREALRALAREHMDAIMAKGGKP